MTNTHYDFTITHNQLLKKMVSWLTGCFTTHQLSQVCWLMKRSVKSLPWQMTLMFGLGSRQLLSSWTTRHLLGIVYCLSPWSFSQLLILHQMFTLVIFVAIRWTLHHHWGPICSEAVGMSTGMNCHQLISCSPLTIIRHD